jgi:serine/threonine-protein kinase
MEKEVQIGQLVAGKYRIEQTLGRGGMGVVVAALHEQLGQRVALKFLTDNAYQQAEAVARFVREARAAVQIQSEHVARVMDVGTLESGAPYMVMEYLRGLDLKEVSTRRGPLPVSEAVDFVLQACDAVAEAHSLGIVHRDLKPSNLFLSERPDGSPLVKVLDFGISKALHPGERNSQLQMTASAAIMGSPQYMSPEQIRSSKSVDARADVWALGTILHELLTGTPAYVADTVPGLLAMIVADPPPPQSPTRRDAPPELEAVILRCLEKDRERRFPSVSALARALERFASIETKPLVRRIARVLGDDPPPATEVAPATRTAGHAHEPAGQTSNPWSRPGHVREPVARPPLYQRRSVQLAAAAGVLGVGALLWLLLPGGSPQLDAGARHDARAAVVAPSSAVAAATPGASAPAVAPAAATGSPAPAPHAAAAVAPGAAPAPGEARIRPIVEPLDGAGGSASTAAARRATGERASSNADTSAEPQRVARGTASGKPTRTSPSAKRAARPSSEAGSARASSAPAATPPAVAAPAKKADTLQDLFNDTK